MKNEGQVSRAIPRRMTMSSAHSRRRFSFAARESRPWRTCRELLTLCINTDDDVQCDEGIFLFDDRAHHYLWSHDNSGLRNAEVRWLEIKQTIGLTP